jgi:hypothetical protein
MCNYIFLQQGSMVQPSILEIVNICSFKLKNLNKNWTFIEKSTVLEKYFNYTNTRSSSVKNVFLKN